MDESRKAKDLGSDSPASREAQEQGIAGARGAESEGGLKGAQRQPEQGSNRSPSARHNQEPEVRKGFEAGRAPSEQGEKDHPSPHVIARHQQGIEPRGGSHVRGDRSEEEAQRGAPGEEHTRHGRQERSGGRPGNRTE